MRQIIDLLEYTYEQTARQSSSGTLRSVVIHYISCEIRTLIEDVWLRSLLDNFGEMGSKLVASLIQ